MIGVNVFGMAELARRLEAVKRDVASRVLHDAGRSALAPVLRDMPQYIGDSAMENEAHLRDSIAIVSGVAGWGTLTLRVGPSKKHYQKALAQEYGTVTQAAVPFIRPALDHNKTQVLRILAANIRYGIENR